MRFTFSRPWMALACLAAAVQASAAEPALLRERTEANRPTVMFLASPHFANHGQDVNNRLVPDVLTPQRQAEIAKIAQALATFQPTRIAVEIDSTRQDKLSAEYRDYRAGKRELNAEEYQQLGMRIAAAAGHADIYGINWNNMPPGKIEDFDYLEWANKHGKQDLLKRVRHDPTLAEDNRLLNTTSVAEWLLRANDPARQAYSHRRYFDYTAIGDNDNQPGANWLANWYGRNLKIFAKLVNLADQPGDRVLVIYGAGHIPTLRQFAEQSGAFNVADPLPLLRKAQ